MQTFITFNSYLTSKILGAFFATVYDLRKYRTSISITYFENHSDDTL